MNSNINENFTLSSGMGNILDDIHAEVLERFSSPNTSEIPRNIFIRITERF